MVRTKIKPEVKVLCRLIIDQTPFQHIFDVINHTAQTQHYSLVLLCRKSPVRQLGLPSSSKSRSSSASPSRSPLPSGGGAPPANVGGADNANNNVSYQALRSQAREEEKRRLQIEMRKRETELLNKIKQQQKELESMKQEKSKVFNASSTSHK